MIIDIEIKRKEMKYKIACILKIFQKPKKMPIKIINKIKKSFDVFSNFNPGRKFKIFKFNNSETSYNPKIGVNNIENNINFS